LAGKIIMTGAELCELTIALLEAPPESIETQRVMELLDRGEIPFTTALECLRRARESCASQTLSPAAS
jgi:hypothetical protein